MAKMSFSFAEVGRARVSNDRFVIILLDNIERLFFWCCGLLAIEGRYLTQLRRELCYKIALRRPQLVLLI
jgi:hypothetical protein